MLNKNEFMVDDYLTDEKRKHEERLNQISDSNIRTRLRKLYEVYEEEREKAYKTDSVVRLPYFYQREIVDIFSKKDKNLMNYLLFNSHYFYEFMKDLKVLRPVFRALCDSIDILIIYKCFSYFPHRFLTYFVGNFGRRFKHVINEYISLNVEHLNRDTLISRSQKLWKVVVFVCGDIVEEITNFFQPSKFGGRVIPDLEGLARTLATWVKNGYDTKTLNYSIALPILEKMGQSNVPDIAKILNAYRTKYKLLKTTPEQLANKKIIVYQGTVSSIISHSRIVLSDVKIIPTIKDPDGFFELELEELIISISPESFAKSPLKIGDCVYCRGIMASKPEYGSFRLVYYLDTWSGSYDKW